MGYTTEKNGILASLIRPETEKAATKFYHRRALSHNNTVYHLF